MNPFRIEVPEEQLADLRLRLRNARWPDEAPAPGWEQGVELRWLQRLVSALSRQTSIGHLRLEIRHPAPEILVQNQWRATTREGLQASIKFALTVPGVLLL